MSRASCCPSCCGVRRCGRVPRDSCLGPVAPAARRRPEPRRGDRRDRGGGPPGRRQLRRRLDQRRRGPRARPRREPVGPRLLRPRRRGVRPVRCGPPGRGLSRRRWRPTLLGVLARPSRQQRVRRHDLLTRGSRIGQGPRRRHRGVALRCRRSTHLRPAPVPLAGRGTRPAGGAGTGRAPARPGLGDPGYRGSAPVAESRPGPAPPPRRRRPPRRREDRWPARHGRARRRRRDPAR